MILQILKRGGQKLYRLIWSCKIVSSSEAEANYHFDRRGTIQSGRTITEARSKVEAELVNSNKADEMRAAWQAKGGKGIIYPSFIKESCAGSDTEGHWCIKELFMVISKLSSYKL